jgi:hypothetical protein
MATKLLIHFNYSFYIYCKLSHNVLLFMTLPAANRAAGNVAEFLRGNGAAMT